MSGNPEDKTPLDELAAINKALPEVLLLEGPQATLYLDNGNSAPSARHIPTYTERHEILEGAEKIQRAASIKGNSVILNTVVSWVVYIVIIFALYLFWTGHNAPGGGFIAGLMTAAAITLLYVTFGSRFIQNTMRFDFKYLVGIGLSISLGCGLGGMLFGDPFLTHTFGHFSLGLWGDVELATATIFDLGVFFTVTGGCVTIITSISENGSRYGLPPDTEETQAKAQRARSRAADSAASGKGQAI